MHYVFARVDHHRVALPATCVTEMLPMPDVNLAPRPNPGVRGVIRARGQTFPLVDMRGLFGCASAAEGATQLIEMLRMRRVDHEKWIAELAASIQEGRPFTLATDPHQCGFGKWYDHFHTDDAMLASHMRRFDAPHQAIHALAAEVLGLAARGERDEALARVELARGRVLAKLVQLFHAAEGLVRQAYQEIAVLLRAGEGRPYAIAVDSVDTLVEISDERLETAKGADAVAGLVGYAHLGDDQTIFVLDPAQIAQGVGLGRGVAA